MKKMIILLAGYPGTGKSYLANIILEQFPEFQMLSPDEIKEEFWDRYGFDNLKEKEDLICQSWKEYYQRMGQALKQGVNLISDYPFSQKQKGKIEKITQEAGYQVLTIRLVGDLDILFERQRKRDLDDARHLGHILSSYHKGEKETQRAEADYLLTYEEFYKRCTQRGYGEFSLGETIEIDVSDYAKIPYKMILETIKKKQEMPT